MTDLRQRTPRRHDAQHLAFVRSQPCCIKHCRRSSEAAHIRMACISIGKEPTGLGEKPHDKWTVPVCGYHHRTGTLAQHKMAEAEFWSLMGPNPFEIAAKLWIASGGAERERLPESPKRKRKTRPRDPSKPQSRIHSNPVIQSRGFGRYTGHSADPLGKRPFRPSRLSKLSTSPAPV